VDPAQIDENDYPAGMLPSHIAPYLAQAKCRAVAPLHPESVVLAADTVVSFGDQPIGKPVDEADARRMLQLLSGTTHLVITGISVMHEAANFAKTTRVMSAVRMRLLSKAEIDRYLATGDWQGKAGAYGIQDSDNFPADHQGAGPFIARQAGSKTNIVGLPMTATKQLLAEAGIRPSR
jgi:septum formation protein